MSAYMRGYFRHLDAVNLVVLFNDVFQILLPVQGYLWHIVFIQTQEADIPIHHWLDLRCFTTGNDSAETGCNFFGHRHIAGTALCLRLLNHIFHLGGALQLMVYLDTHFIKLNLRNRQSAELGNTKPGMKKNIDCIVVSAEMCIFLDEFQQLPLLLPGDGFSGYGIVDNHRCQLKSKGIFANQVIVHRHLKSRSENAPDGMNGAVAPAVHLLKLDEPRLCIR